MDKQYLVTNARTLATVGKFSDADDALKFTDDQTAATRDPHFISAVVAQSEYVGDEDEDAAPDAEAPEPAPRDVVSPLPPHLKARMDILTMARSRGADVGTVAEPENTKEEPESAAMDLTVEAPPEQTLADNLRMEAQLTCSTRIFYHLDLLLNMVSSARTSVERSTPETTCGAFHPTWQASWLEAARRYKSTDPLGDNNGQG